MRTRRARAESDRLDNLLVAAGRGDAAAFAEFYDRTVDLVFPLVHRALGDDRERASAAAEGIYVRLWRTAPRFAPPHDCAFAFLLAQIVATISAYRATVPGPIRPAGAA